mgnify:CR=1 FL=1
MRSASPLKPATPKKQEDLAGDIRTFLRGFKSNIVKIFGNLSYRNREIQDEVIILFYFNLILLEKEIIIK